MLSAKWNNHSWAHLGKFGNFEFLTDFTENKVPSGTENKWLS